TRESRTRRRWIRAPPPHAGYRRKTRSRTCRSPEALSSQWHGRSPGTSRGLNNLQRTLQRRFAALWSWIESANELWQSRTRPHRKPEWARRSFRRRKRATRTPAAPAPRLAGWRACPGFVSRQPPTRHRSPLPANAERVHAFGESRVRRLVDPYKV